MLTPSELDAYAAVLFTLGRFHREPPDTQTLSAFAELVEDWPLPVNTDTREGLRLFHQSSEVGESSHAIDSDHNWLYGVSATAKVPPFESVHRDKDGLLFDEQTMAVRGVYRQLGLQVPNLNREPDDHVGVEMDFLAQCCLKALDALDVQDLAAARAYLELSRRFLDEHVNQWAPEMLQKASQKADTAFMQGLALASIGVLRSYTEATADLIYDEPS